MTTDNIPPRPWRVEHHEIQAADGCYIVDCALATTEQAGPTATLIVRLVNAEAQVVEALAEGMTIVNEYAPGFEVWLETVEGLLALLRGDRPGEGGCDQ